MANSELKISPSKLERAVLCPGSVRMTKDIPFSDSKASRRGRTLHDCMALLFQVGEEKAWPRITAAIAKSADCVEEDIKQVKFAFEMAMKVMPEDPNVIIIIEKKLNLDWLGLSGGTPDCVFLSPLHKAAVLIDWKFGSMPVEDPETNWQMRSYGAGLLTEHLAMDLGFIEPVIIQPASFREEEALRSGELNKDTLRLLATEIKKAVVAAKAPDAPTIAGQTQCRWCDAKEFCASYKEMKAGKDEAKAEVVREQLAQVSTMGTPLEVASPEPLVAPVIVVNAETVALANQKKAEALAMIVSDNSSAQMAGMLSREVRGIITLIDKNRENVKKPLLNFGRLIDASAKEAMGPLIAAADHLDAQVRTFVQQEQAKADKLRQEQEAARRKAEEEERQAREAKARAEREALEAKQREEAAALKEANARSESGKKKAAEAAAKAKAEREALEAKQAEEEQKAKDAALQAEIAEQQRTAVASPEKVTGFRGVVKVTWEIPDLSAVPKELVAILLAPNAKVIDSMIKTGVLSEEKHAAWLKITRTQDVARSR